MISDDDYECGCSLLLCVSFNKQAHYEYPKHLIGEIFVGGWALAAIARTLACPQCRRRAGSPASSPRRTTLTSTRPLASGVSSTFSTVSLSSAPPTCALRAHTRRSAAWRGTLRCRRPRSSSKSPPSASPREAASGPSTDCTRSSSRAAQSRACSSCGQRTASASPRRGTRLTRPS